MLYVSDRWEVTTQAMIDDARESGKKVAIPYVVTHERRMEPSLLGDRVNDLTPGPYGIYQQRKDAHVPVSPGAIDVVVVPGVAFTDSGDRLGRGGGYYDAFLKELPEQTVTVGIAFADQVVTHLPQGPGDVAVQKLITEIDS